MNNPAPTPVASEWDVVLSASERRVVGARLVADLTGAGLLLVGAGLFVWRPDQAQVAALVQAIAAAIVAAPILVRGLAAMASLRPRDTTDQLVVLAVLGAMAQGSFATATLVPLVLDIGRLFEERTSLGARAAIRGLRRLGAREATRLNAGVETAVAPGDLVVGDTIRVRPGQVIPVDGTVLTGTGAVDQAAITGESRPEDVGPESDVFAGTVNLSGMLDIRVTSAGDHTVLGRVATLLREVAEARPPLVRTLERLGAAYVPVVLVLAATTLFFTESAERAIAVLVVAAPTALVVAGPAAMVGALTAASRNDILLKGAGFLEAATSIDTLVIDKTGTLTEGRMALVDVIPVDGYTLAEVVGIAAIAGQGSLHPVARAVVAAHDAPVTLPVRVEEVPGRGTCGWTAEGIAIRLGRADWLRAEGVDVPASADGTVVSQGNACVGWLRFADQVRPGAAEAVARVRALGVQRVVMVTGDRKAEAERVAALVGVDAVVAEVLPEDKLSVVKAEQAEGRRVLMVGDGVNDALALSQADVGVAVGVRINEVALGGADVALLTEAPGRIPDLLALARLTRVVFWTNLSLGVGIGVVLLGLASRGAVSPLVGALLHDVGALVVVAHSARLLRWKPATALSTDA